MERASQKPVRVRQRVEAALKAEHRVAGMRRSADPLPARRIRDRFGLSPATAIATAELAGFPTEGGSF